MEFEGIYFSIKEAAIPLFLAIVCLISIYIKKPVFKALVLNLPMFDQDLIKERLAENNKEGDFEKLMRSSTYFLVLSFIISAILNFIVALFVFKDIDKSLSDEVRKQILNEQVADMTWMGYVFIAVPLTLMLAWILWLNLSRMQSLTNLSLDELLPNKK